MRTPAETEFDPSFYLTTVRFLIAVNYCYVCKFSAFALSAFRASGLTIESSLLLLASLQVVIQLQPPLMTGQAKSVPFLYR